MPCLSNLIIFHKIKIIEIERQEKKGNKTKREWIFFILKNKNILK